MVTAVGLATFFGVTGATAASIGVGWYLGAIVVNLVISAVLGMILAPDTPKTGRDTKGLQNTIRDTVAPRRAIYGETICGGPYALIETYGTTNEWLKMIVVLAGHPVDDILGVIIADEYVDISTDGSGNDTGTNDLTSNYYIAEGHKWGDGDAINHVSIIKNNGWGYADYQYVTDGQRQECIDDRTRARYLREELVADFEGRKWQTNWNPPVGSSRDSGTGLYGSGHKLTNCANIYLAIKYNRDVWTGFPTLKFHVRGKRLYNPYLDSSRVTDGADSAGTHDINDPDTWEWSEDWTLCVLDYLLNNSYGLGAKVTGILTEIDWSEAIQAHLDSSALVTNGLTGGEQQNTPRYTINGILETSSTPISNMEALLTSGGGALVYGQGQYKIRPAVYRAPESLSDIINEDMIVSPLQIQTHTPRSTLFNKAAGVFVDRGYDTDIAFSKDNRPRFEPSDFAIVDPLDSSGNNPYEDIDGEEIIREFDFPFTTQEFEAQRLARIQLERVRQGLAITFEANLQMLKYSVGDTVYLEILSDSKYTSEAFFNRLGLDDDVQFQPGTSTRYYKQFKILDMQYTENSTIQVSLLEESEEIYNWNDGDANLTDHVLESAIIADDPTGTVLPPSFIVPTPYVAVVEDIAAASGTSVTTLVRWVAADRGSTISAIDQIHISYYRLEYGQVTDPSIVGEGRVTDWIQAGNRVSDHSTLIQGPIALETLYKDGVLYDFRIAAVTYSGRQSAWAYYSTEIGSDYDPSAPPASSTTIYYIQPTNGTAIKNGTGTLTVEAHRIFGGVDSIISSGTIQLYVGSTLVDTNSPGNYPSPSDGYTGTFGVDDILGNVLVELKDGPTGDVLDTISLVDVQDGGTGVSGYIEAENGISWIREIDGGDWAPTQAATDLDCTFVQDGEPVARIARRVNLNTADGTLTASTITHKDTDFNLPRVSANVQGSGTKAITVTFDYLLSPDVSSVTETVTSALGANSGISVYLTDDGINLTADENGENYTLPVGTISQFYVYDGPINVTDTSAVQFQVIGAQPQNLLTCEISDSVGSKGEISLTETSPGWSTDVELFLLRATYKGIDYDKVFAVHKLLKGQQGIQGDSPTLYYIKPVDGTAIKNGIGNLTIEARTVVDGVDSILSSGTILLHDPNNNVVNTTNNYVSPSDGYTGILDTGDIDGSKVITLKDGISGQPLDTITLVDIDDGLNGTNAYYGYIEASNGLAWVQAANGGAWSPLTTTTQLDFTVVQNGLVVAQDAYLVTRSAAGLLTGSAATHSTSPGNFSDSPGSIDISSSGTATQAFTVNFTYTNGSDSIVVSETVLTAIGGDEGPQGPIGATGKTGWGHDLTFSSADADTVAWTSGTVRDSTPTSWSIALGTTGDMLADTTYYILLDTDISTTELTTTTVAANSVGENRILIAVAKAITGQTEATFQVFGGAGGLLLAADEIAANTITANNINATFYNGAQFTGGTFQTREPLTVSPYSAEPRAVIQQADPQIAVYSNIDNVDTLIFGITEVELGSPAASELGVEITLVGDFVAGSLDTAKMYSVAGIEDLRGRLGVTPPVGNTGGIATLSSIPQTLSTTTADYELDIGEYITARTNNTLTFTIQDSRFFIDGNPTGMDAPVWDLDFFYSETAGSGWVPISGGDFQVTGTVDDTQKGDNYVHTMNLNATRNVDFTPPGDFDGTTETIYYMLRVVKISGDSWTPVLSATQASEAVIGSSGIDLAWDAATSTVTNSSSGTDATLTVFDATNAGLTPTSSGATGATDFLRADGTWQVPGGGGNVTASGTPLDNEVAVFTGGTDIDSDSTFTWDGTTVTANALSLTTALGETDGGTGTDTYTQGNILYASAANVLSKLAIGSAGTFLRSNASTVEWSGVSFANSATTGDIIYASGTNNYDNLTGVATGNALISGGVGTAPSWGKIALTTHISGVLPEANGGTNQSTYTTGDILYASAANTLSKLAAGTNTHVLTLTGGVPTWVAPTGGTVTGTGTTNTIATWNGTTAINTDVNSFLIQNAVDKTATETISNVWTFSSGINMSDSDINRPVFEDYGIKHQTATVIPNAVTVNCTLGNSVAIDMDPATAAVTLTLSNPPPSGTYGEVNLEITMGTPAYGMIWPGSITWLNGGSPPTLSTTNNAVDFVHLSTRDGGTNWYGTYALAAGAGSSATTLSTGTVTATTYGITSDGGTDDVVLLEANTTQAGLLGADKWDEIVANTLKVTNATHTGQVTGSGALTLDITAITDQPASGALVGADTILINDGGVLSEATMTQLATFIGAGTGTVTSVGAGTLIDITGTGSDPIVNVDLSEATAAVYAPATDFLIFLDGGTTGTAAKESGIDFAAALAGTNITATNGVLSVAAPGDPDQNLFQNVASDSGTAVADSTTDTLSILGGNGISTAVSGDTLTITRDTITLGTNTTGNYVGTITGGTGIDSTGATTGEGIAHTLSFDGSELTDMTAAVDGSVDELILLDSGLSRRKRIAEINLGQFNNDQGWTNYSSWTVRADSGSDQAISSGEILDIAGGTDISTVNTAGFTTINHSDTSALSGQQGSAGVSSVTVDGRGHVTAVGTATYLTSYSETDTLASVTGRGATTATASTFSGGLNMSDSDLNRPVLEDYAVKRQAPTVSANAVTVNCTSGNYATIDMDPATAAVTLTLSNPPASGRYGEMTLEIIMGTPAYGMIWPGSITWLNGGSPPTLTTVNDEVDFVHLLTRDGGTNWYGTYALANASGSSYTLPEATSTVRGGIELFSDTEQSVAAEAVSATASRTYGIQLNSSRQAVVNVPWTTGGSVAFNDLTDKTSGTGNYTTTGDFTADNFEATGLGPNTTPGTDDLYIGGYGILGSRTNSVYVSNAAGPVALNHGGVHGSGNTKLVTTSTGVSVTGTMAATTVTGANVTSGSNPGHTHTAYLTGNQTITLSGDVTGSGTTAITCTVGNNSHTHTGTTISALDAGDTTTGIFAAARIPSLSGDVTGTINATVVGNDSHTHAFNNLTSKTGGTGNYTTSGTFTGAVLNATSDARLKDNIELYVPQTLSFQPMMYDLKDTELVNKIGYIAQDVMKELPAAVDEGEDGTLSIDYNMVLVAKIAELEERLRLLEDK